MPRKNSIKSFVQYITEDAPPGMENWVINHKKEISNEPVLYATSWKLFWDTVSKHKDILGSFVDLKNHKILDRKGLENEINKIKDSTIFNIKKEK